MWFLKSENCDEIFYIKPNTSNLVGCKNGEIILKNDKSISRKHATISNNNGTITLIDHGSKYGTYTNENISLQIKIQPNLQIVLRENDRIKFGLLQNEWVMMNEMLVTCPSTVQLDGGDIAKQLQELGVKVSNAWTTECTHLTMPTITLTMKVVLALSHLRPIVTPAYWTECYNCYRDNLPMPGVKDFLPENKESSINQMSVNFDVNVLRSHLFDGKIFLFFCQQQMNSYCQLIKSAKGKCVVLNCSKMSSSELLSPQVVVVQAVKKEDSEILNVNDVIQLLSSKDLRCIPEAEIGLAILYASTDKYCNPAFNIASVITHKDDNSTVKKQVIILAPESQDYSEGNSSGRPKTLPSKIVNETIGSALSGKIAITPQNSINLSFEHSNPLPKAKLSGKNTKCTPSKRPLSPEFKEPPRKKQLVLNNRPDVPCSSKSIPMDENELFNFTEDKQVTRKKKSQEDTLFNVPSAKRKKATLPCNEGDLFNFSADVSDGSHNKKNVATGQLKLLLPKRDSLHNKPSTSTEGSLMRKDIDPDIPKNARGYLDVSTKKNRDINEVQKSNSSLKINVNNCSWKSCKEYAEKMKNEIVDRNDKTVFKSSLNDEIEEKLHNLTLNKAIVVLNDNLIKRQSIDPNKNIVEQSLSSNIKNFKKFVKVQPRRLGTTAFTKKDFAVYEADLKNNKVSSLLDNMSVEEEPENDEFEFISSLSRGSKSLTSRKQTRRL